VNHDRIVGAPWLCRRPTAEPAKKQVDINSGSSHGPELPWRVEARVTHEEYLEGEARCRQLASSVADEKARQQLLAMADEYAARAAAVPQDKIRGEPNPAPANVPTPPPAKLT
jgi:hypothetical protein